MKSLDDSLAKIIEKAIAKANAPLVKKVETLEKAIAELTETSKIEKETFHATGGERFITKVEARKRLGVNKARFAELLSTRKILTAQMPQGREKVLESSLDNFMRGLQVAANG